MESIKRRLVLRIGTIDDTGMKMMREDSPDNQDIDEDNDNDNENDDQRLTR